MFIFSLLFFDVLVIYVKCYNLDFEYAVAKKGPSNSFFGFSVAEHQDTTKTPTENWILVGAPKANDLLLQKAYNHTGAIFKCRPNDPSFDCVEQVHFDEDVSGIDYNKANQWLGVSLKSGGKGRVVVTCAHRYEFYGRSKDFRLLEGKCFSLKADMELGSDAKKHSACTANNLDTATTSDHAAYGQCQSGIGLDILPGDGDATSVIIGAAGTKWWLGEIFEMDTERGNSYGVLPDYIEADVLGKDKLGYRNSLFGYAVTYGNFLTKDQLHIAVGGPRHKHFGTVLLYSQKVVDLKNSYKKLVQEIPGNITFFPEKIQIASGFGIALCAIDSDNNGLSELVVGAPFYLSQNGKERPERGIVYIYSKAEKENKLVFQKTIQGEEKHGSYSNFGYSVASAGDLNLDGFEDLIVGAPREEDNAGAIYIYFGTKHGLRDQHIQRIAASAVHSGTTDNIGLKGFGRSLGTGVDLDDNGYKDVLVGAYLSDRVALLRSRPIIKVASTLEFTPNKLDTSTKECPQKLSACTRVKLCFNVSEPSGKLRLKNQIIRVKYDIEADPVRGTVRKSRVHFTETKSNMYSFIGNSTMQYKCHELGTVSLVYNDDGTIVEYPDIMFRVSYQIPYGDPTVPKPARSDSRVISLDAYPVLQQDVSGLETARTFYLTELKFKRNCTTCIPDLNLTSPETKYTLRLNGKEKKIEVTIENIGEDTAYSLGLDITLPPSLQLNDIVVDRSIACPKNKCPNIINKFNRGEKKTVSINLVTNKFDPEGEKNISILVTSANQEKPETMANNKLEILFDLRVEADLELFTAQKKKSEPYGGTVKGETAMKSLEDAGPYVRHTYAVRNNGPDKSPLANLTIFWPYETLSGKHLLYLVDVTPASSCVASNINVLNLKSDGSSAAASSGVSTVAKPAAAASPSVNVQSNPGNAKKRTRRETTSNDTITNNPQVAQATRKRGIILNCTTARCIEIKCTLANISSGRSKTIEVTSILWKSSLLLDYPGEDLTIISNGEVIGGVNASYIRDKEPNNQEQEEYTVVSPITPKIKEKILVWQIAIAVVAGVILLGLMIYGLYKVGFFHRTRKHDENGADQSLITEKKGAQ